MSADNKSQMFDWSEDQIKQAQAPFQEHCFDQFLQTLAARGYPVKTAEEGHRMLHSAYRLQEKIATGKLPAPKHEPSAFDSVQEKLAKLVGGDDVQFNDNDNAGRQLVQDMVEKSAAAATDPYIMYQAMALAGLQE